MCDYTSHPGGREAAMAVIQRNNTGTPTVWCDPCISPLIRALNEAGIKTVASCCGHGGNDASIALEDGRWLVITDEPPVAYKFRSTND